MRKRFWIEAGLAVVSGFLLLLTLVNSEWIEASFRVDPDGGNGSLEWLIVAALLATTVAFGVGFVSSHPFKIALTTTRAWRPLLIPRSQVRSLPGPPDWQGLPAWAHWQPTRCA